MKKGSKGRTKILAGILVVTLLVTTIPEFFSRVASAAENAWKVVQSPTSVIEEIYCFDGENYAGGENESGYRKSILADSDMNVVFQGSETRPLMISSDNDKGYYYGDFSQQSEKFSGFYEVEEKDTDGGTWRGVIDKKGREIIPMKKDMDDYNILIGTDGLIYFKNGKEFCYNVQGKEILSEKIVLQSNYIKEKFPNADSVEFDYYRYNGYVALFIQTGRRRDKNYFELKGNILDYPVAKEIAWGHCNGKKRIPEKTDYEKKITSCLENYLKNEEEKVVSVMRAEGITGIDDVWGRDEEYFQMTDKANGESSETAYWIGYVEITGDSETWIYYYVFDGTGNCIVNGREKDTLYCWSEKDGQKSGYSYRQGDYFLGYDCTGEQMFKVPVQDENSGTNIINVEPIEINGESYYRYWDKVVGKNIWKEKQFGILDESGKIVWDAEYGVEKYKDRTISKNALIYGKIVYEDTAIFDYENWKYNYLDYNYVYDLKTKEFLGKYDDCVVLSDDSLCIAYTDENGVGHATVYEKDRVEFEVTLDELEGAKQWSVKKIEGSDNYGFYGYKKASCGFPLREKRGFRAAVPNTWKSGWNLGGQCAVIVDAQGNKLQSAVADSVYVNETKMQIMVLKSGDYTEPPVKPLRTPSSDSSEEETPSSKTLPEITYTGFVNGIERTLLLKPRDSYYVYLKIGEEEPISMGGFIRDAGMDRYGTIWILDEDDNTIYWHSYDLSAGVGVRHWYGIEAAYENTAALVFEGSGSQAIVTGYETFSGEIYPLLTFDEQKAIAAPESDVSAPVYIPSQTLKPGTDNPPAETVGPSSSGTVNPSASTAMPSVGTAPQTPSSSTPNQSSKISSPAKVLWKSAKNIKGKKVALAYKKVTNAKGYQIMYATDKKFSKNKKVKFTLKTSYVVPKLKKGKTYYFKVRAYHLNGMEKVYGAWSGTKKIKIKK